ncbi:hypothetical protein B0H19DRAFT_1005104, partial [Mycena capillaripes]
MGYHQQALMVGAAAALHNFLRLHEPLNELNEDDDVGEEYWAGLLGFMCNQFIGVTVVDDASALNAAEKTRADDRRDRIAQAMWNAY